MANISFTGSTSGFTAVLDQLTTFEQSRITPVNNQKKTYQSRDTAFDTLKTALTKLESANEALAKANSINKTSITSGESKAFTATTSSSASSGSYSIEVENLAAAHSLLSSEFSSSKDPLGTTTDGGTRTLTISQPGQEKPLEIQLTDKQTSLEGIRDAINKTNGSVSASIIKADDNTYYLALTAKDTGTQAKMTVSVTGDTLLNSKLNYTPDDGAGSGAMKQQAAAENAVVKLNGITITRQSNTVTDAVDGVSLNLKAESAPGTTEKLTIATDTAPMKKAIQEWVDAYNSLQTTIGNVTHFTAADPNTATPDSSNGVLLGNSTVRGIQTTLKTQISSAQSGMSISTLNEMGIKQNPKDGKLEIDATKLQTSLAEKSSSVTEFFVGDGKKTGFATQVNTYLDGVLDTSTGDKKGAIQIAKDSIADTLKTIEKTRVRTQLSIDDTIARYKSQFSKLDKLVSDLNSTGDFLTKQFAALTKSQ
ncbi:flagellar filament capping protein FliD [Pectobacterium parmentieri]|uniref:Flagellar hook-associated protein 2 n=1 Tax=Pectobacterium parmentieri TaxID=1905730 RepID=A0A8B3F824_PECPM|nr:flagellar filament capping protein FliD [Pectobacterium parmentieri]AOR59117.1 flagellar filament capping protein FliD [Pectobacterium parmentieri]AYH01119.1 flagellar filament capping protein FliD [Pectobacterium parmentieri]AYH09864.1 flagellar filament capping protein FliD [Pectobacterium parmentieri]AYH19426.1 flagellar filament capping protein FliD [Pectobacterium parmentieri]AYH27390.1 flagellar filament capping protein FliD [Pectobacterium parmentieri]